MPTSKRSFEDEILIQIYYRQTSIKKTLLDFINKIRNVTDSTAIIDTDWKKCGLLYHDVEPRMRRNAVKCKNADYFQNYK